MARKLKEEYEKWGLYINIEKTKYLCIGEERENIIFNNGEELKPSIGCTYLGIKLDHSGDNTLFDGAKILYIYTKKLQMYQNHSSEHFNIWCRSLANSY